MHQQDKTGFHINKSYSAITDLCINIRFILSCLTDMPAVQPLREQTKQLNTQKQLTSQSLHMFPEHTVTKFNK